MTLSAYRVDDGAVLHLRSRACATTHNVEPDDVRRTRPSPTGTAPTVFDAFDGIEEEIADADDAAGPMGTGDARGAAGVGAPKPVLDVADDTDGRTRVARLRAFVAHFLRRRPTADELLRARILDATPAPAPTAPALAPVRACCTWLAACALDAEGLFRVSAARAANVAVADALAAGTVEAPPALDAALAPVSTPGTPPDPHAVATGLKIYLRERTLPLVPHQYYKRYLSAVASTESASASSSASSTTPTASEARAVLCQRLVSALPANNQMVLLCLFRFLHAVARHADRNKMPARNLGVVFGPVIVRAPLRSLASLQECEAQITLAESLVLCADRLSFGAQAPLPPPSETPSSTPETTPAPTAPPPMKAPTLPSITNTTSNTNSTPHLLPLPVLTSLPAAPVPGLVANVPDERLHRALRTAPAGTFAVTFVTLASLASHHNTVLITTPCTPNSHDEDDVYRVHCVGAARVPFVCEVRRVPASTNSTSEAWAIGTSTAVHYRTAHEAVAQLAHAGIACTPLPVPVPDTTPNTSLEDATAALHAAAQAPTNADTHPGTVLVTAGRALAQCLPLHVE